MSTTVRIEEADKERLRVLQEKWRRACGEHASQQEVLSKGLAYLERHTEDFLRESTWKPLTEPEIRDLEKRMKFNLGSESLSDKVDEILYGLKR